MLTTQQLPTEKNISQLYPSQVPTSPILIPSLPDKPDITNTGKDKISYLTLDDIITSSTLFNEDPIKQSQKIIEEFNEGIKEDITIESVLFGKRIDQDEYRLVHRNNVPQLVPYTYYPRRLGIYVTGTTEEIGIYKQNDLLIGKHGRYLVNVPQGRIAKAWLGNNYPVLLGPGPHVIRHPNFRLEQNPLVYYSEPFIAHGNFAVIRVPRGKLAKVWLGSTPYLLESRPEPYVFNDPTFKIMYTEYGGVKNYFSDASEKLITHGSIKRILPLTGEVAVTYDNGNLQIIEPKGEPVIVDSPSFIVDGFQQTAAQTLVFPSKRTQEERRKSNPQDTDSIEYEVFRTSDGQPIGVKLLVVFEIFDPKITLRRLKKDDIINHIENIVVADMGRVIQSCNSSDFQKSNLTAVKDATKEDDSKKDPLLLFQAHPTFYAHLQDDVKNKLAEDFRDWGIRLVRLNIETPKILNVNIAEEMAQNSLKTAKTQADASTLTIEYTIKQQRAAQEAEKKRIEMEREKQNKIVQAEGDSSSITIHAKAELEAAKLRAEAERIEYENKNNKDKLVNETFLKRQQMEYDMKIKFLKERAQIYDQHETIKQVDITQAQAEALRGVTTSIISPEVAQSWYSATQGLGFFSLPIRNVPTPPKLEAMSTTKIEQPSVKSASV